MARAGRHPAEGRRIRGRSLFSAPSDAATQIETFQEGHRRNQIAEEGQQFIGFREVPVDNSSLSKARPDIAATEPYHLQVFIGAGRNGAARVDKFERKLFLVRKVISQPHLRPVRRRAKETGFYPVSLSSSDHCLQGHVPGLSGRHLLSRILPDPRGSKVPWRSCTNGFRPIRFRGGSCRTPIGLSPIMARSTRCAATTTGWRRDRRIFSRYFWRRPL